MKKVEAMEMAEMAMAEMAEMERVMVEMERVMERKKLLLLFQQLQQETSQDVKLSESFSTTLITPKLSMPISKARL